MDPAYQEYAAWMARNAPVPRFFGWMTRAHAGSVSWLTETPRRAAERHSRSV